MKKQFLPIGRLLGSLLLSGAVFSTAVHQRPLSFPICTDVVPHLDPPGPEVRLSTPALNSSASWRASPGPQPVIFSAAAAGAKAAGIVPEGCVARVEEEQALRPLGSLDLEGCKMCI